MNTHSLRTLSDDMSSQHMFQYQLSLSFTFAVVAIGVFLSLPCSHSFAHSSPRRQDCAVFVFFYSMFFLLSTQSNKRTFA
jgi:hypothetical protein